MQIIKSVILSILVSLPLASFGVFAASPAADSLKTDPAVVARIQQKLAQGNPKIVVLSVKKSAISGLYDVILQGGTRLYFSEDENYFIHGTLFRITADDFVDVAEEELRPERARKLAAVDKKDMIIFSPAGEIKTYMTVFTDVDCGFCAKLHNDVPALNAMGIEVRYLAFPRAGIPSPSYDKVATAWCAKDRKDVLTRLKRREQVDINVCPDNPVAAQFALGNEIGVKGTPAIFTSDGTMISGYKPPDKMAADLGIKVEPKPVVIAPTPGYQGPLRVPPQPPAQ